MKMDEDPKVAGMTKEEIHEHRQKLIREIIERRIGFHSWRHKLNTILRAAGVPDAKIRFLTGHRTSEMTDWYTQFIETDMEDVTKAQVRLLDSPDESNPPVSSEGTE
jgi:integrase